MKTQLINQTTKSETTSIETIPYSNEEIKKDKEEDVLECLDIIVDKSIFDEQKAKQEIMIRRALYKVKECEAEYKIMSKLLTNCIDQLHVYETDHTKRYGRCSSEDKKFLGKGLFSSFRYNENGFDLDKLSDDESALLEIKLLKESMAVDAMLNKLMAKKALLYSCYRCFDEINNEFRCSISEKNIAFIMKELEKPLYAGFSLKLIDGIGSKTEYTCKRE